MSMGAHSWPPAPPGRFQSTPHFGEAGEGCPGFYQDRSMTMSPTGTFTRTPVVFASAPLEPLFGERRIVVEYDPLPKGDQAM